jgi:CpeT protein
MVCVKTAHFVMGSKQMYLRNYVTICFLVGSMSMGCGDGETASPEQPLVLTPDSIEQSGVEPSGMTTDIEPQENDVESNEAEVMVQEMQIRLDLAFEYLTGLFDSQAQSLSDFSYFNVQLVACEVSAPDLGERVLYLEQAMARDLSSPYRQRLYVIRDNGDERVASDVYTIYDDDAWVGLCSRGETVTFTTSQVSLRQGCTVYLTQEGDGFEGGTEGEQCRSNLGGAAYAVSEVNLTRSEILSWDRGFDFAGSQVWGAEAGPYEFLRQSSQSVVE